MIGNTDDAAYALRMYRENDISDLLSCDGSTRMVYLINGVVYKVNTYDGTNEDEYDNISSLILPEGYRFPITSLYRVLGEDIIAMEYISGQCVCECYCTQDEECAPDCAPRDVVATMEDLNLDIGGFNVIVDDNGIYYIVDAA